MQVTATDAAGLNGRTPLGVLTGETPDMSQHPDFGWCDWVWFEENEGLSPPDIGRFLGVAHASSLLMTCNVLPESGIPIQAGTVHRVTEPEKLTDAVKEQMSVHTGKMSNKFKVPFDHYQIDRLIRE